MTISSAEGINVGDTVVYRGGSMRAVVTRITKHMYQNSVHQFWGYFIPSHEQWLSRENISEVIPGEIPYDPNGEGETENDI